MTLRGVVERSTTLQTQHQDQPGKGRTVRASSVTAFRTPIPASAAAAEGVSELRHGAAHQSPRGAKERERMTR